MKKFLVIFFLLLVLISCGPKFVYPHLNWLIPWYVSDFISLDSDQKNMLEMRLQQQIDWHCRTQLPTYAEFLRALSNDLANKAHPIDYQKIQYYYGELMALWKELLRQIGPDITDILLTASDEQIHELFSNLQKRNQKFREKYIDPPLEELNKNRQERLMKNLKYWISNLTPEEMQAVSDWSTQLVPIASDWLQNRERIQGELRRSLAQRSDSDEFRAKLLERIVNPEQMRTAAFQQKMDYNTDVTIRLIIRLERLLTPEQRAYLLKRIESLSADFDKLSCDPKELPSQRFNQQNPAD